MWVSCILLFTTFVFAAASPDSSSLSHIADITSDVQRHVESGCVALLLSSAQEMSRSIAVLLKLLSAREIATVALRLPTLNITHDDANCQHNRPLYVLTESSTLELKELISTTSLSGPKWLLFSNSSILLEHLFTDIYIPFDCEFLVAREGPKGAVSLFEVYRVNRTSPLQNLLLAVGNQKSGFVWDKRSLYERRNDLCGATIKATTFENHPVVDTINSTHTVEIGGMFGRVWYTIAEQLNYRTEVHLSEDSSIGALSKNGTWTGVIRMLVDQVVDVAVGDVTMTSRRVKDIDFSAPLLISRTCLFIRRPESSYQALHNILAPFSSELWLALQGAIVLLGACLSFAYYVGRRYNSPEKPGLYTLPQALLCVLEIFCQQGHEQTPRTMSCRLIYWVSYMTAVVLFAAYSGALISSLALQRIDPPFTTLSGLLQHGGYSVATMAKSAHFNNFDQATDKTMQGIYEKLFDKDMPSGALEGLRNICGKRNYAFMTTYSQGVALVADVNCRIIALKDASLPESMGVAFIKRSPYLQVINLKLLQLRNTGILRRIRNSAWPIKAEEDKTLWTSVRIEAVTPIYAVLAIGVILGTVLMFLERQASNLVQRSSRPYRTSGRRDPYRLRRASP